MKRSGLLALASVSLCLFVLGACNSAAPTLRYITVAPTTATISVGTTQQFTATAYYSDGSTQDATATANWASSNTAVATVTAGVATAVGAGTATISASAGGQLATATLNVNALLSITVTPANKTVAAGAMQQYTAMGTYKNPDGTTGTPTDITSLVTWASSVTGVATIDNTGLATAGMTNGVTVISATLDGAMGKTNLTVGAAVAISLQITPTSPTAAIGNATTFTAMELFSDTTLHTPAAGTQIDWTSGTTATATLANASSTTTNTNITTALAAGTTMITATEHVSGLMGNTMLTVVVGTAHYSYVSVTNNNAIQSYTVSASSSTPFTSLALTGVDLGTKPPILDVLDPSNQYLYAIDTASNLWQYSVDPTTGKLTPPTTIVPTLVGETGRNSAAIDPYGRFVYVTDDGTGSATAGSIAGFKINSDGTVTAITGMAPGAFTTNMNQPTGIIIERTGKYLYVTNFGATGTDADTVAAFAIDQNTGALTPLSTPTFPTGSGPFYGTVDPTNTYLFIANSNDNSISGFTIGSGGVLTAPTTTTVTGTPAPFSIFNLAVDPSGTHIYAVDSGSGGTGEVYGYNLSGGTIGTAISGTPIATGLTPLGNIVIDPTGKLMAVDNNFDNTVSLYTIGSGGALTALTAVNAGTQPPVGSGNAPLWVIFFNAP